MKKPNTILLRTLTAVAVIALVCLGLAVHTGFGTPSAFGVYDIAAICPLGAIETALASKTIVPPLLIALAIIVAITLLLGRVFCAWGCPIPLLNRIFKPKAKQTKEQTFPEVHRVLPELPNVKRGGLHDSRNWVLGAALLTTAAFGFPVFCLVCPVGLTFATAIAVWRVFQFSELSFSLLVFPAILILEFVVLRKWCHRFCPLGALLSLISRGNKTLRPHASSASCLNAKCTGTCSHCAEACPEGIDLHNAKLSAPLSECTKCRSCADACPVKAIRFPLFPSMKGKKHE